MIPEITVVIPVYNRADIVGRTLDSVAAQTWRPLSVVLVDNNSTDGTLAVLEHWRDMVSTDDFRVRVISEPTPGAPAARNAGLSLVDTEWTMFFDSDDTMHPRHIETAMRTAHSELDASIVGWDVTLHQQDGSRKTLDFTVRHPLYNCVMHGTFATHRYMCRTCLFSMAGGWGTDVSVWNDIELGVRLLKLPHLKIVKRKGRPMVDVYFTERSITGSTYSANGAGREHALDIIDQNIPLKLKFATNLKRVILAALYRREGAKRQSKDLLSRTYNDTVSVWQRGVLRVAYVYTAVGLPGIARLLEPFVAGDDRI